SGRSPRSSRVEGRAVVRPTLGLRIVGCPVQPLLTHHGRVVLRQPCVRVRSSPRLLRRLIARGQRLSRGRGHIVLPARKVGRVKRPTTRLQSLKGGLRLLLFPGLHSIGDVRVVTVHQVLEVILRHLRSIKAVVLGVVRVSIERSLLLHLNRGLLPRRNPSTLPRTKTLVPGVTGLISSTRRNALLLWLLLRLRCRLLLRLSSRRGRLRRLRSRGLLRLLSSIG